MGERKRKARKYTEIITVSRIIIDVKSSDGTFTKVESFVPKEVTEEILLAVLNWRERYKSSFETVIAYLDQEQAFRHDINIKKSK